MMLSLDTAYRSFGGEVEASSTPTICRLSDSRRHQLWAIARATIKAAFSASTSSGRASTPAFMKLMESQISDLRRLFFRTPELFLSLARALWSPGVLRISPVDRL